MHSRDIGAGVLPFRLEYLFKVPWTALCNALESLQALFLAFLPTVLRR